MSSLSCNCLDFLPITLLHFSQRGLPFVFPLSGTLSKKTRRSTGRFPFKRNRGWLKISGLAANNEGKSHSVSHHLQTVRHTDVQPVEEDVTVNQEHETSQ